MAINRVRLSKTKARNVDRYGAYHPPNYYQQRPPVKPIPKHTPIRQSTSLENEFRQSTVLSIPRDAIPDYLSVLVKEHGRTAVQSALMYQYDIYRLRPGPIRDWLAAALEYLNKGV